MRNARILLLFFLAACGGTSAIDAALTADAGTDAGSKLPATGGPQDAMVDPDGADSSPVNVDGGKVTDGGTSKDAGDSDSGPVSTTPATKYCESPTYGEVALCDPGVFTAYERCELDGGGPLSGGGVEVDYSCTADSGADPCAKVSNCCVSNAMGVLDCSGATTRFCLSNADCNGYPPNAKTGLPLCVPRPALDGGTCEL